MFSATSRGSWVLPLSFLPPAPPPAAPAGRVAKTWAHPVILTSKPQCVTAFARWKAVNFFYPPPRFWGVFSRVFLPFFRVTPAAYGGSQARGRIGATAANWCHSHSNTGSESHLRPTPAFLFFLTTTIKKKIKNVTTPNK